MVKAARAQAGPGALRPLNEPQPMAVQADERGQPVALTLRGERMSVGSIEDQWRIEDEWWRDQTISRAYFEVLLADGRRTTVFRNNATGEWYGQHYG